MGSWTLGFVGAGVMAEVMIAGLRLSIDAWESTLEACD